MDHHDTTDLADRVQELEQQVAELERDKAQLVEAMALMGGGGAVGVDLLEPGSIQALKSGLDRDVSASLVRLMRDLALHIEQSPERPVFALVGMQGEAEWSINSAVEYAEQRALIAQLEIELFALKSDALSTQEEGIDEGH